MVVVSDTSPLNYLLLIAQIEILPALFEKVALPQVVFEELQAPGAPEAVRRWTAALPDWVSVHPTLPLPDEPSLDPGEAQAIFLAESLNADLVLLDERRARRIALSRGLAVAGILGVLERGAVEGLLDLNDALDRLVETNFRIDAATLRTLRELAGKYSVSPQEE